MNHELAPGVLDGTDWLHYFAASAVVYHLGGALNMRVEIELPDIRAISRNDTAGKHYGDPKSYHQCLITARSWVKTFGKRVEHHFENPVDVGIFAYFDERPQKILTKAGPRMISRPALDCSNVDDKLFVDALIRYYNVAKVRTEAAVWFIEDDSPKYLRRTYKESIPSDHDAVIIVLEEVS